MTVHSGIYIDLKCVGVLIGSGSGGVSMELPRVDSK